MVSFCLKQISRTDDAIVIPLESSLVEIGKQAYPVLKNFRYLSQRHAKLTKKDKGWFIKNLNSKVGTYVNFRRITKTQKLKIGDIIGFGVENISSRGFICTFSLNGIKTRSMLSVNKNNNNSDSNKVAKSASFVNSIDDLRKKTRKCFVKLIKCDSKHFKLPSDVKSINNPLERQLSYSFDEKYAENFKSSHFYGTQANYSQNARDTVNGPQFFTQMGPTGSKRWNNNSYIKPNSVTAVVKPFHAINDSKKHEENCAGYSETDKVYYIPDDDSHLDFYSSEPITSNAINESDNINFSAYNELPEENDLELIYDYNACPETVENIDFTEINTNNESMSSNVLHNLEHENFNKNILFGNERNNLTNSLSDTDFVPNETNTNSGKNYVNNDILSGNESDVSGISLNSFDIKPDKTNNNSEKNDVGNNIISGIDNDGSDNSLPSFDIKTDKTNNNSEKNDVGNNIISGNESDDSDISLNSFDIKTDKTNNNSEKNYVGNNIISGNDSDGSDISLHSLIIEPDEIISNSAKNNFSNDTISDNDSGGSDVSLHSIIMYPSFYKKTFDKEEIQDVKKPEHKIFISKKPSLTLSKTILIEPKPIKPKLKHLRGSEDIFIPVSEKKSERKLLSSSDSDNEYSFSKHKKNKISKTDLQLKRKQRLKALEVEKAIKVKKQSPNLVAKLTEPNAKKRGERFNSRFQLLTDSMIEGVSKNSKTNSKSKQSYKFSVSKNVTNCDNKSPRIKKSDNNQTNNLSVSKNRNSESSNKNQSSNLHSMSSNQKSETISSKTNELDNSEQQLKNKEHNYIEKEKQLDKKSKSPVASHSGSQNLSTNEILQKIVKLRVTWIEEQRRQRSPPPAVYKDEGELPLSFNSYEHYVSAYQPMLMLEIWRDLCKSAYPILDSNFNRQKFYFTINKSHKKDSLFMYDCESLVNQCSPAPTEGNIVILAIKAFDVEGEVHSVLGYICNHQIVNNYKMKDVSLQWNRVASMWIIGAKLYKFSVVTNISHLTPKYHNIMRGNVIVSVKKRFHLAAALKKFKNSPLCNVVLKPDKSFFVVSNRPIPHHSEIKFSPSQHLAIESISSELQRDNQEKKIFLLQGGPGTGKSHTILGLLEHFIFSNRYSGRKILITAPSSITVDQIASRIIDFNERLSYKKKEIKFVYIGTDINMNAEIKDYSLDIRANSARAKSGQSNEEKNELFNTKIQILQDSHVIISTLKNCWHPAICSNQVAFAACIVDEATQCTEIEILQPLALNIHKLVLVGDYNQLPPSVNSQIALQKHFDRSMFERLYRCLSKTVSSNPSFLLKTASSNPIFFLKEQFRMHPQICMFPSQHFYHGELVTIFNNNLNYPIPPYTMYDVIKCDDTHGESVAVAEICNRVLTVGHLLTIGVIVPHKEQVNIYEKSVAHIPGPRDIEINTIDYFQGKEKDVVIISCFSPKYLAKSIEFLSCKKRLNVALTRARYCLIVCVNSSILCYYDHWNALIYDAKRRGLLTPVPEPKDISRMFYSKMLKIYDE